MNSSQPKLSTSSTEPVADAKLAKKNRRSLRRARDQDPGDDSGAEDDGWRSETCCQAAYCNASLTNDHYGKNYYKVIEYHDNNDRVMDMSLVRFCSKECKDSCTWCERYKLL